MKEKKLKDLKKGDPMWLHNFTDTTPITVVKKKRTGSLMTVTLKWDNYEFECFGPALGWTCISYNKKFCQERLFTSSWERAFKNEQQITKIKRLKTTLTSVIKEIDNI